MIINIIKLGRWDGMCPPNYVDPIKLHSRTDTPVNTPPVRQSGQCYPYLRIRVIDWCHFFFDETLKTFQLVHCLDLLYISSFLLVKSFLVILLINSVCGDFCVTLQLSS